MLATNYGLIPLVAIDNNNYFTASSDHGTAAYRPKLVVEYTLLTANSRIILLRFR